MTRAEKAVEFKKRNNCCQAVLLAFADKLPFDETTLRQMGSGFVRVWAVWRQLAVHYAVPVYVQVCSTIQADRLPCFPE